MNLLTLKTLLINFFLKNGLKSFTDMNVISFLHELLLSDQGGLYDLLLCEFYNNHHEGSLIHRIHKMLQILIP
jgi:hypothetical protein